MAVVIPFLWVCCWPTAIDEPCAEGSYLHRAAFCLDDELVGPAEAYVPQPGDIFLATDQALWARVGHWLAGGAGVHHSGVIFLRSDGRPALLEAGPFNSTRVEAVDAMAHMHKHLLKGDKVWIRRRRIPLTPDQSTRLTAFAEAQEGKPFAVLRMLGQVTPFRSRGPLRSWYFGTPHGSRYSYFCSELVMESLIAAGLLEPDSCRPVATYPRDLFFGRSFNWYVDRHLHLDPCWYPPARWTECRCPD
jgi:hypothetical protein